MIEDSAIIEEFKRLTLETLTHDGHRGILAGIVGELVGILENAADFQIDSKSDVVEGETVSSETIFLSAFYVMLISAFSVDQIIRRFGYRLDPKRPAPGLPGGVGAGS